MIGPARQGDAQIHHDVLHELIRDPGVPAIDVGVAVDLGVVTLTGTVCSWAERHAAQEAAHRVARVLDVANDIEVKLPGSLLRTDTNIARAVRDALRGGAFLPDQRIHSTVGQGIVTLEGTVDLSSEREDAEYAIRNLAGVRRVINNIRVVGMRRPATQHLRRPRGDVPLNGSTGRGEL